jgi:hypothetical protein
MLPNAHRLSSSPPYNSQFQFFNQRRNRYKHIKMTYCSTTDLPVLDTVIPFLQGNFTTIMSDFCNRGLHPNAILVFSIPGFYPNPFSKSNCKLLFTSHSQIFLYPPTHWLIMESPTPTRASLPFWQPLLTASLSISFHTYEREHNAYW